MTKKRGGTKVRRPLGARAAKAARTRLLRRLGDLTLAYIAAGRATAPLKKAVHALKADIDDWRERSGGRDLRATNSARRQNDNTDPDDWSCTSCAWIMNSMGRICFLVGCDPDYNQCSYICFTVPRDPNYPVS